LRQIRCHPTRLTRADHLKLSAALITVQGTLRVVHGLIVQRYGKRSSITKLADAAVGSTGTLRAELGALAQADHPEAGITYPSGPSTAPDPELLDHAIGLPGDGVGDAE